MKIEIRGENEAFISGYVNVTDRFSKPIRDHNKKFVEKIEPGAFAAAIEKSRTENRGIYMLADHDGTRRLAGTPDGSLRLKEDNIGLYAEASITEKRAVERAKKGDIKGWSFGFYALEDTYEERAETDVCERTVKSLDLTEVSLIYDRNPCYTATSCEVRAGGEEVLLETRSEAVSADIVTTGENGKTPESILEETEPGNNIYEYRLRALKAKGGL